ncbi:hypothetical protein [Tsukamurella soli]|uniref:hypothetical protein n=1 Tax=Tsukamurella soli TaxID=644556 RepID=UPI0031E70113
MPAPSTTQRDDLVSFDPRTGAEVGRHRVATPEDVVAAVTRARSAARWWTGIGPQARRF